MRFYVSLTIGAAWSCSVAQTMPSVWTTMDPLVDAVVTLSDNKFNVLERLLSPSPPGIVPNPLSKKWRLKAG